MRFIVIFLLVKKRVSCKAFIRKCSEKCYKIFFLFRTQIKWADKRTLVWIVFSSIIIMLNHGFEAMEGAVVHVWAGQGHIAQAGYFEIARGQLLRR